MVIARTLKGKGLFAAALFVSAAAVAFGGCKLATYENRVVAMAIDPAGPTVIPLTMTQQFTATATYADGTVSDVTEKAAWRSSNVAVATVTSGVGGGLATPVASGETKITASLGGVTATATLTVNNAQLQTIAVAAYDPTIVPTTGSTAVTSFAYGTTVQLKAIGHYDDGVDRDLTTQATWDSSDADVTVGVTPYPDRKAIAASTAAVAADTPCIITATFNAIPGSTTLTVKNVTLQSLAVTPSSWTLKEGASKYFTATGTFSDASTQNLTREVTWTSSNDSVATVSSVSNTWGRATGVAAQVDPVTIQAKSSALLGSKQGTAQLTVEACTATYGCS